MTRKKRDSGDPETPEAAERPPETAGTDDIAAATAAAGDLPPPRPEAEAAPSDEQQAQEPGGPVAPTPATQAAETARPAAAGAGEPVAATPETQHAEPAAAPVSGPGQTAARAGTSAGGAFLMGLLASLLVLAVAAGALWATRTAWGPWLATLSGDGDERIGAIAGRTAGIADQVSALSGRLDGLERTVAGLRDELAQARQQDARTAAAAPAIDPQRIEQMAERLQTVEAAQANRVDPARVAALGETVERLGNELARTQEALAGLGRSAADAATVLRLSDRVDAAEAAVRQAQSRVNSAQNLLLAVGQLREAVGRGEGFDAELRAVAAVAANDPQVAQAVQALAPLAGRGIPSRTVLAGRFEELAGQIVRADIGPKEDGWWRQTVQRLAGLVTVRRTEGDVAGDSVAAIVARAEAALDKGNLAAAVQELETLQGPAAETAAPWLQAAKARLTTDKALSDLTAHAVSLAQANG